VASGGEQNSTIRFAPTEAKTCDGILMVVADHTAGNNQRTISARALTPPRPWFTRARLPTCAAQP